MPAILDVIVGHKKNCTQLISCLDQDKLAPTYLFIGPSGIGKKKFALGLAQTAVCEQRQRAEVACGQCPSCKRVSNLQSENLLVVSPATNQIKIDQSREVLRFLNLQSLGKKRFVIIDEAHKMNPQAANALLKSLEEPPANTHFILTTHSSSAVLSTIRSRAQVIRFSPLQAHELKQAEAVQDWMLDSAQGSFEALHQLQAAEASELREQSFRTWQDLFESRFTSVLQNVKELASQKEQSLMVTRFWQQLLRDSVIYNSDPNRVIHKDFIELIEKLASCDEQQLLELGHKAYQLERNILNHIDRSLCFENYFYEAKEMIHG